MTWLVWAALLALAIRRGLSRIRRHGGCAAALPRAAFTSIGVTVLRER